MIDYQWRKRLTANALIKRRFHKTYNVPDCSGSGGRNAPDWMAAFKRNRWPDWPGEPIRMAHGNRKNDVLY